MVVSRYAKETKMNSSHNKDRWNRLWEIFHQAREKAPSEREEYLKEVCGSDLELRKELDELLESEKDAGILTKGVAPDATQGIGPDLSWEDFRPGDVLLQRYQIVELHGRGGMGTVYKALDMELGRQVALKFLTLGDPHWSRRFLLEARVQARMEHAHICKVYEVGEVHGKQYIAMQFIPGTTMLEASSKLSVKQKVKLLKQVCEAIHAAHQLGVIHRDIKPTNILVGPSESGELVPYVTDFGLARELTTPGLTSTGMVMGTAWYMAPEQARGDVKRLDARCDIHALGATLYEFLSGKPPFQGDNSVDVLVKVINEEATPLRQLDQHIPIELETIVQKCLQKEPSRRYESAAALAQDLNRFLEGEPILARPVTWTHRAYKRVRKYPIISGLLAAAFVAVVTVAAFAAWTWWHAQAQAKLANEFEQEIRFMEETARHAYTEPLHDIREEEAIVEKRLNAIEQRITAAGSAAEGPGNFAMGRGNMALYRYPEARTHLEIAWKEYRIPRVAFALGLTLGLMYQKEFERANRIPDPKAKQQKLAEIDKEFKQPALRLIKEGSSAVETPEYVESLIAFLDKRYVDALEKTQAAFRKQPWFFEAKKLEADIYRAMANESREVGDTKKAIEHYQKADAAYREAVRKGSSYALGYGSLCALGFDWTSLLIYSTGVPDEKILQKSIDACNNSLKVNPDRPEAYIAKGALLGNWGMYDMSRGMDPTSRFSEAINAAKSTLKWEWTRFAAYNNMAVNYSRLGAYKMQNGQDAGPSFDQSIESYREALNLDRGNASFHNNLATSLAQKGTYEKQMGRDPTALQDEAIKEFQEAIRIDPKDEMVHSNVGEIYFEKAQAEYEKGKDPQQFLELSKTNLNKSLQINPNFFLAYNTLGENYKLRALLEIEKGTDATVTLNEVIKALRKSTEINDTNADGFTRQASANAMQAELAISAKRDPSVYIFQAQEAVKKADKLAPGVIDVHSAKAEVEAASVLWKMAEHNNKEALKHIDDGLKSADKILKENPRSANGYALKGRLLLRQSYLVSSKAEREKVSQLAKQSFQQAVKLNRGVARKFAADLKELTGVPPGLQSRE
jgi:serine/threonine-protein kinase